MFQGSSLEAFLYVLVHAPCQTVSILSTSDSCQLGKSHWEGGREGEGGGREGGREGGTREK